MKKRKSKTRKPRHITIPWCIDDGFGQRIKSLTYVASPNIGKRGLEYANKLVGWLQSYIAWATEQERTK